MKIIVHVDATFGTTGPFQVWRVRRINVSFSGTALSCARIIIWVLARGLYDMNARKVSVSTRPALVQAPWFHEGAGYLLAIVFVGTELLAGLTYLMFR
jgi:hypothetical protein